jgi:single-strand DNA-binding protein
MASDFATIQVNGRLTNDPRSFPVGETTKAVDSVAVNRYRRKKGQEDLVKETTFIDITCWGATAERLMKYGKKGAKVTLTGDWETDEYEKDGETVRRSHINVRNISIFTEPAGESVGSSVGASKEDVPF